MNSHAPPLTIIHEDPYLFAVDKPAGMFVHRSREAHEGPYLLQVARDQLGKFLYPVHRLDRAVSGVILFGASSEDAKLLSESLGSADARKEYLALVRGSTADEWRCDHPLTSDSGKKQEAATTFKKLAEFSRCSLLLARIHTGRRHQIRRHLAHAAHQIIGDTSYGKGEINRFFRAEYALPRLFLHAYRISFAHPRTRDELTLRAPLARDLLDFLHRLPDAPRELLKEIEQ